MLKKLLILVLLGYGSTAMAESLANEILKNDTLNSVGGVRTALSAAGRNCQPDFISAEVLQQPTDLVFQGGVPVSGYWREEWTLQCDAETAIIPITFVLDPTGASWKIVPEEIQFK